jgi:hypothetical protein
MTTIEDRLLAIEQSLKANVEATNRIESQLEVITPRDMVEMKTGLARLEARVYAIAAFIAGVSGMFVSWLKGLVT